MKQRLPMRKTVIALIAVALLLPSVARAEWGEKSRACPRWEAQLAALEQAGQTDTQRYMRIRNRIADRCVAMNEVQVLGSHNSYHIQPKPALLAYYLNIGTVFEQWQYTHPPLDVQFETQGIRQIELDVWADPQGGLFARRGGLVLINENPNAPVGSPLYEPGFKVLHIQDYDFGSNCLTLVDCLETIKSWSDKNEHHLPLVVLLELKDDTVPDLGVGGVAAPVPLGPAEMDALDAEIRSVFSARRLITPDKVRRGRPTLEQGVLEVGWPRLGVAREKIMFLMDNGGHYRTDYLAGHPSLEGRVIFTSAGPGNADAGFIKMNDPQDPTIPDRVADGYLVRTRSDADTLDARANDTTDRDAALASGAQFVSTDYPVPDPQIGTGFFVEIPGGMPARCNPVNAPPGCREDALERLD